MIEEIKFNNTTYAHVMRADTNPENTEFYTPKSCEFQLGMVAHKKGYVEPAHIHKLSRRVILNVTETLTVVKGSGRINFFSSDGEKVGDTILDVGDTILLKGNTGHNFEALEDFKGVKTKQGPYVSMEDDKIIL